MYTLTLFDHLTADANVTLRRREYEVLEGYDELVTVCAELVEGILERGVAVAISTSDDTAVGELINNNIAIHQAPHNAV